MRSTDISVRDVAIAFEDFTYRTPIKFGGVALDRVTILNVTMGVETGGGKKAKGFGSMPLGNVWAWPTKELTYDQTLAGMKYIAARLTGPYRMSGISGHPIDINDELEPRFFLPAVSVSLVIGGLYRFVRNPMYLAVLTIILGQALLFGSATVVIYAAVIALAFTTFVRFYEEPTLAGRYGAEYEAYRNAVPGWLPRLTPWRG